MGNTLDASIFVKDFMNDGLVTSDVKRRLKRRNGVTVYRGVVRGDSVVFSEVSGSHRTVEVVIKSASHD